MFWANKCVVEEVNNSIYLSSQEGGSFQNHFGSFLFDRLVVVPPPSMSNELKIKLWWLWNAKKIRMFWINNILKTIAHCFKWCFKKCNKFWPDMILTKFSVFLTNYRQSVRKPLFTSFPPFLLTLKSLVADSLVTDRAGELLNKCLIII